MLRRTLPLWLAWVLYAAPALWAVQVFRAVTAMPNLPFNDTTIYDENGTVISNGPGEAEQIGWLARFGLSFVLSFGTLAPAAPEMPLFGLAAAVVVSAVWTVRARSFHLRSVAAVGALFSVGLAVVGLLVVVSRDATHEAVRPMWGPEGLDQFDGQFGWGLVPCRCGARLTRQRPEVRRPTQRRSRPPSACQPNPRKHQPACLPPPVQAAPTRGSPWARPRMAIMRLTWP